MRNPDVTTLESLKTAATGREIESWLRERKNRRAIPHRLEKCGYAPIRNNDRKDGLWIVGGRREVIYGRRTLSFNERISAARKLAG
jgi:hypothetical protein